MNLRNINSHTCLPAFLCGGVKFIALLTMVALTRVEWSCFSADLASSDGAAQVEIPAEARKCLENQALALSKCQLVSSEWITDIKTKETSGKKNAVSRKTFFKDNIDSPKFFRRQDETQIDDNGKRMTVIDEISFDGRVLYHGNPDRNGTGSRKISHIIKAQVDDITDPIREEQSLTFAIMDMAGIFIPTTAAEMHQSPSLQSLPLVYIAKSESTTIDNIDEKLRVTVVIPDTDLLAARKKSIELERKRLAELDRSLKDDGFKHPIDIDKDLKDLQNRQKMEPKRRVAFLLDPKMGYAVVKREEWTYEGKRIVSIASERWNYYKEKNIWLPKRSVASYYTYPGNMTVFSDSPYFTWTTELDKIEFRCGPDVPFTLDQHANYKKPGSMVVDRSCAEAKARPNHKIAFVVAADGKLALRTGVQVFREQNRAFRFKTLIAVVIIIALPGFVYLATRRAAK